MEADERAGDAHQRAGHDVAVAGELPAEPARAGASGLWMVTRLNGRYRYSDESSYGRDAAEVRACSSSLSSAVLSSN